MNRTKKNFAGRLTGRILTWMIFIVIVLSYVILYLEGNATRQFYAEIYYNKMLITNEYTRRVISDVYVAVKNNIYYLEQSLDNPDGHKETMERIVKSGTRVRSCGISFIKDYYYPQKEHRFCPFAWRSSANADVIYSQDMGDADFDYLSTDWFIDVVKTDSAVWSKPFFDGYDSKTALSAYMRPVHDKNGKTVAVLSADISLDWLTNKLNETDSIINKQVMMTASMFEMKSNSFIINNDGTYITHSDEKRIINDNFFDHLQACGENDVETLSQRMNKEQDVEDRVKDRYLVNGEECYVLYSPVKYTQWILITLVPCQSIDMLSYLNGFGVVVIVLLAMALIVFIVYYYTQKGIAPLKQLAVVTDDIAKGKLDTPIPSMHQYEEISQLRDSIEELKLTLSNYNNDRKRDFQDDNRQ